MQHFGRADVVGQALSLGAGTFTIVAVAPAGFAGIDTENARAWAKTALEPWS